jgi:hypothetical protein
MTTVPGSIVEQPDLLRKVNAGAPIPMPPTADGLFTTDQVAVLASGGGNGPPPGFQEERVMVTDTALWPAGRPGGLPQDADIRDLQVEGLMPTSNSQLFKPRPGDWTWVMFRVMSIRNGIISRASPTTIFAGPLPRSESMAAWPWHRTAGRRCHISRPSRGQRWN